MVLDDDIINYKKPNAFEFDILILIFHGIIIVAFGVAWFSCLIEYFSYFFDSIVQFEMAFSILGEVLVFVIPIILLYVIFFLKNRYAYWIVGLLFGIAILIEARGIYRLNQSIKPDDSLLNLLSMDPLIMIKSSAQNIALFAVAVGLMFRKEMKSIYY